MAFFDLRISDELSFRVGRFTPQFGAFPIRHDPANHRTSDKPLPYDMGRMLRTTDWNMGILPSPWVDNGVELSGAHFFSDAVQIDYAAYAVGGPRAANNPIDFEYKAVALGESYYLDKQLAADARRTRRGRRRPGLDHDHRRDLGDGRDLRPREQAAFPDRSASI